MWKWSVRLLGVVVGVVVAGGQEPFGWTQLSLSTCRVDAFLKAHAESNGRGVVVAVLDTGVDPSIPGLTKTPDGQVKVIDVQDFTGQGDVEFHTIHLDPTTGNLVEPDEDGNPIEYVPPAVPPAPPDHPRRWWFGTFDEKKFVNSDQPDINDNGKTDDKFPILVTACDGDGDDQALCFVDTNLDRSFADEKPLANYKLDYDTFTFFREKPEKQIIPLTFAVNIFLKQRKAVVHFDDGAHGTHVAGIAAGYRINDQDGFDGVAPGARVISLKIGNNALGGVSTTESMKQAFQYAARFAREHKVPVVCNMSYGVESEIEGHSDIDEFVNELLRENPYLVFCTSAGNAGPGLSTIGTPAAAAMAITVGALMAADTGRDVAGYAMDEPVITVFSSRGGELDKPDIATPGWSTSTVPRWVRRGDFWSGTSMASPYAAGLCAVLISHVAARQPGVPVRACDVKQALHLTARPAPSAAAPDTGYGIPDLPAAAELLDRLVVAAKDDPVLAYDISTPTPHGHKGRARVAYWRGTYFPSEDRQAFTIKPIFSPGADASVRTGFTRKFSTAPWCRVPQETFYLHAEQETRVFVEYDAALLKEPGLYVGVVEALADQRVALRLVSTIVVPHRFGPEGDFTRTFRNQLVEGWVPQRYFVMVPPGASAMKVKLVAPEDKASKASIERVFDPAGVQFRSPGSRLDPDAGRREVVRTFSDKLTPGVWEIPVVADRPDKEWPYDLAIRFFGLKAVPERLTAGKASKPSGDITITNLFDKPLPATADGQIEGYRFHKDDKFKGLKDELSYAVKLDERFDRLRLRLEMTPEDYAKTTDIGVMVQDDSGKALYKSGFDWRTHEATVSTGGAKSLKVVINGGFAVADDKRETPIIVDIDQLLAEPVAVKVTQNGESNLNLAPGVPIKLEYAASDRLKDIPEGRRPVGFVRIRERATNDEALRVTIDIGG